MLACAPRGGKFLFASFVGAFFIAVSFGYSHYRFSKFNFFDFSKIILYTHDDVFVPTDDEYILLFYSSKKNSASSLVKSLKLENKTCIAIDFAQNNREKSDDFIAVTGGFDKLLMIINSLNLSHIPSAVNIKKDKNLVYKQDTSVLML